MTRANELPQGGAARGLEESIRRHIRYSLGREVDEPRPGELYEAVALAVRDACVDRMLETERRAREADAKRLYYLSMEFLMGTSLENNLVCLGLEDACREAVSALGSDLGKVIAVERDAALGNGGLGRLAACFLDSLASLGMPGYGYGINYEYGLFRQEIHEGYQVEKPDNWQARRSPWQIERPDEACIVPVYGRIVHGEDRRGHYNPMWLDWRVLVGVPHDMPIVGYGGQTVNYLRLYSARSSDDFDMEIFNEGDYLRAVEQKMASETISKVLYPSDSFASGRELRLLQEYFFVACAIRDIFRRFSAVHTDLGELPRKAAIQLNDTHPALAVAELMRCLVDEHDIYWDSAWDITRATLAYTNHTLLPEALETWPVDLFERVLPRHLQIIYEVNHRFLQSVTEVRTSEGAAEDVSRARDLSIFEENGRKQVRMAHLAIVGSHAVNGVAEIHSRLVTEQLVPRFHEIWPKRFTNVTNGITPRRWLRVCNPGLSGLITDAIGDGWITDLDQLRGLEAFADDGSFQERFRSVKRENKERLASAIYRATRSDVDPGSLFDVQAKRIHEYKRQLLNAMNIIYEMICIREYGWTPAVPKTYIFAGKAAPGYWRAKEIIKLITSISDAIERDPKVREHLRVVFLPDYRVSLAERIVPGAEISEQISTAGKEASGTGNMKFALNGALTIGTLDGANIEIREEVGEDNIFIFGLEAHEIERMRQEGSYNPWEWYHSSRVVRSVVDSFRSDLVSPGEPGRFEWVFHALMHQGDEYFHLADLESYVDAQRTASREYRSAEVWTRKAIHNVAGMGKFSSDRSIGDYAREIWSLEPVAEAATAR